MLPSSHINKTQRQERLIIRDYGSPKRLHKPSAKLNQENIYHYDAEAPHIIKV